MKKHELKTDPDIFDALARGEKTVELRKDDRGYQVEDHLHLRRTMHSGADMANGQPLVYTGEEKIVRVNHILRGPGYGIEAGWVAMSVGPVDDKQLEPTNERVAESTITAK